MHEVCEGEIRITIDTNKFPIKTLSSIEKVLMENGIHFDTGYDPSSKERDWFWDWSLDGPVKITIKKIKLKPEVRKFEFGSTVTISS